MEPASRSRRSLPGLREVAGVSDALSEYGGSDPLRGPIDSWGDALSNDFSSEVPGSHDIGPIDANLASRLETSRTALPKPGTTFLGFHLIAELGRGAFGRVFLAQQGELANRLVALKISTESLEESQHLAQLQHTHIVPVYSYHSLGPLQAVCMPYFGSTTLADVLDDVRSRRALPASGKDLVSTLNDRRSRTARTLDSRRSHSSQPAPIVPSARLPEVQPPLVVAPNPDAVGLQHIEGLTYVEAILWLGARLADGLAHAHERGILHRDLKPANILLTDDGLPMLLDFNLSENVKATGAATAALIGGTLPYMSPEHLAAFNGETRTVDERSDLYSLGLVLVELLLGRLPFTRFPGPTEATLPKMIAEREQGPPSLGDDPLRLSPAVQAIFRKCLHPDPEQRYASARQLQEDLERQLNHLPLKHTPEPSLRERVVKWVRRNPRVTSAGSVAIFAMTLLIALGLAFWSRSHALARHEACQAHLQLTEDLGRARLLLAGSGGDAEQKKEGESIARSALGRFETIPTALNADEQVGVREHLAEMLLLLAGRERDRQQALELNERATRWLGEERTPRAATLQRARLLEKLERLDEARDVFRQAEASPVRSAWEQTLLAREQLRIGQVQSAIDELRKAVRQDPSNVAAWYLLGNATLEAAAHQLARENDAVAAYTASLALAPTFYGLYFNRGLAYLRVKNYREAEADFARVIELRPDYAEAYLHRATALEGLDRPTAALEELQRAIDRGYKGHRALFTGARLKAQLGDAAGAQRDRAEAMIRQPADEESYIARGAARVPADLPGALADFEAAVRLNPKSLAGLHNQAHIYSEHLNKPREAIERLDRVLQLYPKLASALSGRGVLLARAGERASALRDAVRAVELDPSGETVYQVAGIYARLGDRDRAIAMLARALRQGYGLDLVDDDPDLEPIKNDRRRDELIRAARTLQRSAGTTGNAR